LRWEAEPEGWSGVGQISRWLVRQLAAGRVPRAPAAEAVALMPLHLSSRRVPTGTLPLSHPAALPTGSFSPPFRVFQGGKKNPGTLTFQRPHLLVLVLAVDSFALVGFCESRVRFTFRLIAFLALFSSYASSTDYFNWIRFDSEMLIPFRVDPFVDFVN
jgi:hypothetical protein